MNRFPLKLFILFFLMVPCQIMWSQNELILNDSLVVNSEALKVNMGSQTFGKVWKISFGDYSIEKNKKRIDSESNKPNRWFFATKSTRKSKSGFSFVMGDKSEVKVCVKADYSTTIKSEKEWSISFPLVEKDSDGYSHLNLDNDEPPGRVIEENSNFDANINIDGNTGDIWHLNLTEGQKEGQSIARQFFIKNGEREIVISPITSLQNEDEKLIPAEGYEFLENGKALCAFQYYGGRSWGANKNIIWIDKRLDPKMKLILAASMTAILEYMNL